MMKSLFRHESVRVLPYPDGKTFAFSIIDDTDGSTLETTRPIYDYLFSLGLRTTKTVWIGHPSALPQKPSDIGDTLARTEYAEYISLLRQRGFEIALHNVSSMSNTRAAIAAGLATFTQVFADSPKINVHHEKNAENIYFEFAQSGRNLPAPYRTALFRSLHKLVGRGARQSRVSSHGCSGENPQSKYFWGDLCKANIKYVRTNVFLQDLNTLKCSPTMPYSSEETPYVNYWFDSSNGQDAHQFNSILNDQNIERLRKECGCSILYTHFGKGFVGINEGKVELNKETEERLRAIAGHPEGWYAPVGEILDRLLAFHRVTVLPLPGGILLENRNDFPVQSVTLRTTPGKEFCVSNRGTLTADRSGMLVVPVLPVGTPTIVLARESAERAIGWNEDVRPGLLIDLTKVARKLAAHFPWQERPHDFSTKT